MIHLVCDEAYCDWDHPLVDDTSAAAVIAETHLTYHLLGYTGPFVPPEKA